MTTGLNLYFLTDFWLFLYTYQLSYNQDLPCKRICLQIQNSGFEGLSKIELKSSKIVGSEIYKGKIEKNQRATHFGWPPIKNPRT